ncbi:surface antigen (D15) [Aminomonas paucivorans DSM 12260]|uniref:Surface antigen (D15) n=1 Tax=Aminomonas paucivorans DSM 12260 TaxID=584708 RepID=E3CW64_9BACT|nr:surface antigen (D15) [Aminomonas paucivorans DSM 12260]
MVSMDVEGNRTVVASHILSVVSTKVGDPADEEALRKDAEAIYELGFFSVSEVKSVPQSGGIKVTFVVQENPEVQELRFTGNTVYSQDQLRALCFTSPGSVFNRVFFRNDLQRIKEKYQKDGYVMMRVQDVQIQDGVVAVTILEPRLGEIIIQGNKKTKDYVIRRQLKLKQGDLFNATILRHSLNRIQGMGYFEDVNVGFEPSENPSVVNMVLTVEEGRTNKIGFSIGHGSQSGWSGGINYQDTNWQGLGTKFSVGFETGNREQYWASYEQPFMDQETYAWKVGAYKRKWEEQDEYEKGQWKFQYDQEKTGAYVGVGKKFKGNDQLSWYLTLDWHKVENTILSGDVTPQDLVELEDGTNFSVTGSLTRNTLDPYLSYPRGDVEILSVEQGIAALGGDWDYTKYWLEARYYTPLFGLMDFLEMDFGFTEDNPLLFAARVRAGSSSGTVPWAEMYTLGGADTLRGYDDDYYRGEEMLLGNFELRIPMEQNLSLVFFYDVGKAWKKSLGESFSFSDLQSDKGIGLRVKTPIGNLRVDFAQGDDENQTNFGFGEMF